MHQVSALNIFISTYNNSEKPGVKSISETLSSRDLHLASDDLDTCSQHRRVTAAEVGVCLVLVCVSICVASVVVAVGVTQLEQLQHLRSTTALLRESLLLLPPIIQNSALPAPIALQNSRDVKLEGRDEQETDRVARQKRSRESRRSRTNPVMTGYHFALSDGQGEGRLPLWSNLTSAHSYHRCWFKWVGPLARDDVTALPNRSGAACQVVIHRPGVYLVYGQIISTALWTPVGNALVMEVLRSGATSWHTVLKNTQQLFKQSEITGTIGQTGSYFTKLVTLNPGDKVVLGQNGTVSKISLHPRDAFLGFVKLF